MHFASIRVQHEDSAMQICSMTDHGCNCCLHLGDGVLSDIFALFWGHVLVLMGGGGGRALPEEGPNQAQAAEDVEDGGPAQGLDHLGGCCQARHGSRVHSAVHEGERARPLLDGHPPATGPSSIWTK